MSQFPQHIVERAAEILKTARVATNKVNYTGFVVWKDRGQQVKAFMLYNEHSGQGPIFTAGTTDHSKVFNWLLEVVVSTVQVGQTSIYSDRWMGCSEEPEDLSAFQP